MEPAGKITAGAGGKFSDSSFIIPALFPVRAIVVTFLLQ
jgi:hypothetical protein